MARLLTRTITKSFSRLVSLYFVLAGSSIVWAQDIEWPAYPLKENAITRGTGHYFAWWKLLLIWLLYLAWVKTTDWVNKDTQILKLNYMLWNPINFFPLFLVLPIIALSLPFPIGYSAMVLSWLVPLFVYIFQRNANVEEHDKVMTIGHFRHLIATGGKSMGVDIKTEKAAAHEKGSPVDFTAISAETAAKNQANMILARQNEGYVPAKDLVADSIDQRGQKIMLDTAAEEVTVRYQIDGVWHEADPIDRETGDMIVEVFKNLSSVNAAERRKRQSGEFTIKYKDAKCRASMVSQGTKTGERTIVNFIEHGIKIEDLEAGGMRPKMAAKLKEILAEPSGIIVFSSVPGGGLSTTVALAGKMSDRYMRDFTSFQSEKHPEPVADNIAVETYDDKSPVSDQLQTIFRKDPEVILVHDLTNKEILDLVCKYTAQGKLVLTTIRAKEAVESLLRILLLKVPATTVAPLILAVVNQRLIRKLCEDCKEEYVPSPSLLTKLGIPKGRVEHLYRPPTDEDLPVCKTCNGLGYLGRTSIFELLDVNDKVREAMIKQPKLDVLRKIAKKTGHRSLQDEGVLLVAKGVTSLAELSRALKS